MKLKTLLTTMRDCDSSIKIHKGKENIKQYFSFEYEVMKDEILKDFTGNELILGLEIINFYENSTLHIYLKKD